MYPINKHICIVLTCNKFKIWARIYLRPLKLCNRALLVDVIKLPVPICMYPKWHLKSFLACVIEGYLSHQQFIISVSPVFFFFWLLFTLKGHFSKVFLAFLNSLERSSFFLPLRVTIWWLSLEKETLRNFSLCKYFETVISKRFILRPFCKDTLRIQSNVSRRLSL